MFSISSKHRLFLIIEIVDAIEEVDKEATEKGERRISENAYFCGKILDNFIKRTTIKNRKELIVAIPAESFRDQAMSTRILYENQKTHTGSGLRNSGRFLVTQNQTIASGEAIIQIGTSLRSHHSVRSLG